MCRALVTALAACRFARAPACQFISWSASASRSFWRTRVFSLLTVLGATPHWSAISAGDLPINVSRIKAASRGLRVCSMASSRACRRDPAAPSRPGPATSSRESSDW